MNLSLGVYNGYVNELEDMFEGLSYMSGFFNFLRLACLVMSIIGMWTIFSKAGEPGWGALIPYYRTYLLYKVSDMKKLFWLYLAASLGGVIVAIVGVFLMIGSLITMLGDYDESAILGLIGSFIVLWIIVFAASVITLVLKIINAIKLSQAFNLNGGYAVGIFFLPFVFYMIIGLSKNIYYKGRIPASQGFDGQGYAQNLYGQNPYGQNTYNQNPYGQNPYGQTTYQQNNYQQDPYASNQYSQTTYAQNAYDQNSGAQNTQAQNPYFSQNSQPQNPYANPPKDEAWKTIYDDNSNNLNQ